MSDSLQMICAMFCHCGRQIAGRAVAGIMSLVPGFYFETVSGLTNFHGFVTGANADHIKSYGYSQHTVNDTFLEIFNKISNKL